MATLASLEGVPSAYAATRDGVDVLLRDRGLRKTPPAFTTESLLRGAAASAVLEGSTAAVEQIRAGEGDEVATAAVRLSTEVLAQVPTLRQAPLQALARLHSTVAAGTLPLADLGRPRDADSAERLRVLAGRLSATTTAPAMVVAALVHAEIATAAPFASHNGLVARAAERLVLVSRGVDEKSLLVPEQAHLQLRPQYESNLRAYASATGINGVHSWLLYAAEAYALAGELSPLRD